MKWIQDQLSFWVQLLKLLYSYHSVELQIDFKLIYFCTHNYLEFLKNMLFGRPTLLVIPLTVTFLHNSYPWSHVIFKLPKKELNSQLREILNSLSLRFMRHKLRFLQSYCLLYLEMSIIIWTSASKYFSINDLFAKYLSPSLFWWQQFAEVEEFF